MSNISPSLHAQCPFCSGDGCCYCEYYGRVPVGESFLFKSVEEAENHDPGVSGYDLRVSRGEIDLFTGKKYKP